MTRYQTAIVWMLLGLAALGSGCSRNRYRLRADRETLGMLAEKTAGAAWAMPADFTIYPHPASRFYDPTPVNDPLLPIPAPRLYAYELPDMPYRGRRQSEDAPQRGNPPGRPAYVDKSKISNDNRPVILAAHEELPQPRSANDSQAGDEAGVDPFASGDDAAFTVSPIPPEVWQSLPPECLRRMFEFDSVRQEHIRTFGAPPSPEQLDQSQRLALEDIVQLALINSREYQRQKEILYSVALRLTLQRYDYAMKFSPFGNGTDANFVHDRSAGETVNTLSVPTTASGEKVLSTGGALLARFANDVVLTFNGPDGFAADVGSELLLQMSQSVFQRDIVLESLTQSERDVVYAARDYARFRKQFFRDLTSSYYALLQTYRGIEIDTQDYFTNTRGFNQGQAEYRAGRLPRIQVDQFEQNALRSRSNLISRCNSLESALDNLKFDIGLPPETPINLDLFELENLTLRDEATVSAELVRRARRNLEQERSSADPDRGSVLNFAIDLTRRMLNYQELRAELNEETRDREALQLLLAQLLLDEARVLVRFNQQILDQELRAMPPAPPLRIFQRTIDLVDSLLTLIQRDADLKARSSRQAELDPSTGPALMQLRTRLARLRDDLSDAVERRALDQIPMLVNDARQLLQQAQQLAARTMPMQGPADEQAERQRTLSQADHLMSLSARLLAAGTAGLPAIEIAMDEAMLTALVQRFDLMNERGALADVWRQIKLAGDDLKSILNLNASQTVRTRSDVNRVFDFTFDESQTNLSASFDAPLNRKAQRNDFRQALVNYQLGLRNLMALEDLIKLSIRDDLRNLQVDREQYRIAVASAALAYERVVSTRLQLQLGIENVAARDFLEAQQAYTASLSSVASEHIGYIVDRIDLFLDLELLTVDESGFWPELYNEDAQPRPNYAPPPASGWPYGDLPIRTHHSHRVRRMFDVPPGRPLIFGDQSNGAASDGQRAVPPEELPPRTTGAPNAGYNGIRR